ncbi:MAG TPA: helix-turn-helix transcriptional regulator [Candidatus Limnocylindrales bacterium]
MKRKEFATRRKAMGLSQEKLAEAIGADVSSVRRWERGDCEPQPWFRPRLAHALKISLGELAVLMAAPAPLDASDGQTRLAVGPVDAAVSLKGAELMPRPNWHPQMLDQYETLTNSFRHLDYRAGSGSVYTEAVIQLNRMLLLADEVPPGLYQRFIAALGDTAQLTAWLAIDQQNYVAARQYAALALSCAQEAEDPTLHAYVLGVMSYLHLHAERGPDAVRLLAAALRLADNPRLGVSPSVRSWLCEAIAEAYALTGDMTAGAAFLLQAEQHFDRTAGDEAPSWLGFFNSAVHVTRLKGRCLVKLGDGHAATTELNQALDGLPPHYVRERSGTLIDLAAAWLLPGAHSERAADPESAALAAYDAWNLGVRTGSGRNQRRIRRLLPKFAPYRQLPEVQSLQAAVL